MKLFTNQIKKISNFYRQLRDLLDLNQPYIITKWGFRFSGNSVMANGNFEIIETEILNKLFTKVDILVNVGANIGYYSCLALNKNKYVLAFEPIQRNLKYLLKNISVNSWNNKIEIFQSALGKENDILKIYGGNTGASLIKGWANIPDSYSTYVPVLKLDNILVNRFVKEKLLILIDIEGSEYNMLQGAISTMDRLSSPIWVIEITLKEHQPNGNNPNFLSTFELFSTRGYHMYYADQNLTKLTIEDVSLIINEQIIPKSHNYIFTKDIIEF